VVGTSSPFEISSINNANGVCMTGGNRGSGA
jgi:hypothetical protein